MEKTTMYKAGQSFKIKIGNTWVYARAIDVLALVHGLTSGASFAEFEQKGV